MRRLARLRSEILAEPDRLILVETVDDILRAKAQGKLAVGLHFEGSRLLERDLNLIEIYYKLGIRFCHPVFNLSNSFGGGCAERTDGGLTRFGFRAVEEMQRHGMILDGAHVGYRTTMDIMEMSAAPFIFSHNGVDAVFSHFRNVRDDQIRACARTGGVIGISGANNYLGEDPTNETLFRHVDHIVQLAGPEHVGIGLDLVQDSAALNAFVKSRPDEWFGVWKPWCFAGPDRSPRSLSACWIEAIPSRPSGGCWVRTSCGYAGRPGRPEL